MFLESVGDIFDAQKNTGPAIIGSLISYAFAVRRYPGRAWDAD